jgi:uncharacterized membrane protein YeaQ/YmgE (transglycosylase-associated protein family)
LRPWQIAAGQVFNRYDDVVDQTCAGYPFSVPPTSQYPKELVVVLHIIWMIIIGLVVGFIARLIVPGRQPMGWIATALLGIVGSYVGGTLGSVVFPPHKFTITRRSTTRSWGRWSVR